MFQFNACLTLQDDIVVSASPVTVGHQSLDYIPGNALLGVVAGRLYEERSDASWRIFHSGAVSFGDALPMVEGRPTSPIPICWHYGKGETYKQGARIDADKVTSSTAELIAQKLQPKQLRAGYIDPWGITCQTRKREVLKTAINPESGRASEGQLFSYQTLERGQRFCAVIYGVSASDLEVVREQLGGELRLGRSRSAQFGRATCSCSGVERVPAPVAADQRLILWLLSDAAFVNQSGQPTLAPVPGDLGLPDGELDMANSFIRTRRYSVFNARRQGYDWQREVIRAGSVLVMNLNQTPTEEQLQRLQTGVGLYTEAGLGRMSVNPVELSRPHPVFRTDQPDSDYALTPSGQDSPQQAVSLEDKRYIQWINAMGQRNGEVNQAGHYAEELLSRLKRFERTVQALSPNATEIGVSPTQWASVQRIAMGAEDVEVLREKLFSGANALCNEVSKGETTTTPKEWGYRGSEAQKIMTMKAWLNKQVDWLVSQGDTTALEALAQFAAKAREYKQRGKTEEARHA